VGHVRKPWIGILFATCALAPVPVARAATVTVGSTAGTPNANICLAGTNCTYVPFSTTTTAALVAPFDGAVTSFAVNTASFPGQVRLRVLRPAPNLQFTGAGTSGPAALTATGVSTFATNLPVHEGDVIGLDNSSSTLIFQSNVPSVTARYYQPALADGATAGPTGGQPRDQLLLSATIDSAPPAGGGPTPIPIPTPTPQPLPPPVAGKTVNAAVRAGTVRFKVPGSHTFVTLTEPQQLPIGTTFDTTRGRVTLTSASDTKGTTQHAWFYEGVFKVGQTSGAQPITTLTLAGTKPSCATSSARAAAKRKPKSRHLWGDGKGRFRTTGQFSSATVRGTRWVVSDRCEGTLTRVVRGVVTVRDLVRHKTVLVRAPHQYLARAPRKSK